MYAHVSIWLSWEEDKQKDNEKSLMEMSLLQYLILIVIYVEKQTVKQEALKLKQYSKQQNRNKQIDF